MPRFVTDSRPISAQHPITEFYREEFLKHHRCLQQQRPYYSESAITDVEAALTRIMGQLEQLCSQGQRRPGRQLPPQEVRRRDRPLGLVRSQTHPLTRPLAAASTRPPGHRPGRHCVRSIAGALVDRARSAARSPAAVGRAASCACIAAGKAAPAMAAARRARARRSRIRERLVDRRRRTADVPDGVRVDRRRPSGADDRQRSGRPTRARARRVGRARTRRCWCCCPAARRR